MQEFTSLKVTAAEHADLATQLTTMSTQGWEVVNIMSTGGDLIAYLAKSRPATAGTVATAPGETVESVSESTAGWASTSSSEETTASIPAEWYKDPSGRFEYRYWDGTNWTDHVSRAGVMFKDPPIP
ncbi:MAG: DUF2510 domain-containing protein [Ilumatobacteraceae bacterium]